MEKSEPGAEKVGSQARPYFAVVVGSGFGGAVAACRLAQACGASAQEEGGQVERPLCILERGRRYTRHDFPRVKVPDYVSDDSTSKRVPDVARLMWGNDMGLWDLRNLGELRVAQAAGYGGGSLIYANVHLRAPDSSFAGWRPVCAAAGGCACADLKPPNYTRADLDPYYDRAAEMLAVTPLPVARRAEYPKTAAMADIAAALRGPAAPQLIFPPLAINFDPLPNDRNEFGREQHACTGCGNCTIGCQEGAKNTLDLNYLALAEDLGAEVHTLCEVQAVSEVGPAGAPLVRIEYLDHLVSETRVMWAKHVFLCAGALGSTEILMRSADDAPLAPGLEGRAPLKQASTIGERFYGNGDSLGVTFGISREIYPEKGPTITTTIVSVPAPVVPPPEVSGSASTQTDEADPGPPPWFLLQDGGIPPSLKEGLGLFKSPLWMGRNRYLPAARVRSVILGRAVELAKEARGYWLETERLAPLVTAVRQMVPDSLAGLRADLEGLDGLLSREMGAALKKILEGVDRRLAKKKLGSVLVWGREKYSAYDDVVRPATVEALIEIFPALKDLLGDEKSTMAYVIAAARFIGLGSPFSPRSMMFLCMGPDQSGRLVIRNDHLRIQWDAKRSNRPLFTLQEQLLRDASATLQGELRTNPDWTVGKKPVTVHAQGGCSMGDSPERGVTRPCGRYWHSDAILVLDGAAFPNSVGVNPSATIAAVAERNIELFIRRQLPAAAVGNRFLAVRSAKAGSSSPRPPASPPLAQLLPPRLASGSPHVPSSKPLGVSWTEVMKGYVGDREKLDSQHVGKFFAPEHAEARATANRRYAAGVRRWARTNGYPVKATLKLSIDDVDATILEERPSMRVDGRVDVTRNGTTARHDVQGTLFLEMEHQEGRPQTRHWLRHRVLTGMTYELGGPGFALLGRKFVRDDPGFDIWSDLSTLYTQIHEDGQPFFGVIQVLATDFISRQLRGMEVSGGTTDAPIDDTRKGWTLVRFAQFFFGSAKNAYSDWL